MSAERCASATFRTGGGRVAANVEAGAGEFAEPVEEDTQQRSRCMLSEV
jgi:hypothetical protein